MLVCVKCRKKMIIEKNGVGVHFGHGHVYPGDKYKCENCDFEVILTNQYPVYEKNEENLKNCIQM